MLHIRFQFSSKLIAFSRILVCDWLEIIVFEEPQDNDLVHNLIDGVCVFSVCVECRRRRMAMNMHWPTTPHTIIARSKTARWRRICWMQRIC